MSTAAVHIPTHQLYDHLEKMIPFDFHLLKDKSPYDVSKYHRHSYYEIFFFLKGGGSHHIDFETFLIEDNSLHFVSPGQVHLLNRAADSKGFIILFSREFFHLWNQTKDILFELPFLNNNSAKPIIKISGSQSAFYYDLFEKIQLEHTGNNNDKNEMLYSYLNILLIHSKRIFGETQTNEHAAGNHSELSKKFRTAVENNFIHLHKVSDYTDLLHVSANQLQDAVSKTWGKTPGDLIQERLLLEAKRLLFHSENTVNEVAFQLNFEDPSYFTRFFKKHTGDSPSDFREMIREKYR